MAKSASEIFEQRELFRTTLASIGDGVIATDTRGNVTFENPVAEQLTGWPEGDAKGQPLVRVFHIVNEDSRQRVDNPAFRALRDGTIVGLANHTLLIHRDGREFPIDDSAAPIRNEEGKVIGVVLVFRDVARAARARTGTPRLRSAEGRHFEASLDAIITVDGEGKIVDFNPAAQVAPELLGLRGRRAGSRPVFRSRRKAGTFRPFASERRIAAVQHASRISRRPQGRFAT